MGNPSVPSADEITAEEFQAHLGRYTACIEAISESKGAKAGQKTLAELDRYRYGEALDLFASSPPQRPMELDDVKTLVEWKLRHGKFRPTLMKLVSSNAPATARDTIQKALAVHRGRAQEGGDSDANANANASAALDVLTTGLRGVGPATASLLLAVHDPGRVVFFADEAFYWLCCDGAKARARYNAGEYKALHERARAVAERLAVRAVDVEKVSFVLMRQPAGVKEKTVQPPPSSSSSSSAASVSKIEGYHHRQGPKKPKARAAVTKKPAAKRRADVDRDSGGGSSTGAVPLRRSKRVKQA